MVVSEVAGPSETTVRTNSGPDRVELPLRVSNFVRGRCSIDNPSGAHGSDRGRHVKDGDPSVHPSV